MSVQMESNSSLDSCPVRQLLAMYENSMEGLVWRSSTFVFQESDVADFLSLTYTAHSHREPSLDHVPGFQVLSLMPALLREVGAIPPTMPRLVNYGADRVRFTNSVDVAQRLTATFKLTDLAWRSDQFARLNFFTEVHGLGETKPGMVADLIVGIPIPQTSNLEKH